MGTTPPSARWPGRQPYDCGRHRSRHLAAL